MSDSIKHECGVALLRLRQKSSGATGEAPAERETSSSAMDGAALLALMLEKQRNRGQDGAGAAILSLSPEPGTPAWRVFKDAGADPLASVISRLVATRACARADNGLGADGSGGGSIYLGHLRYATYGRGDESFCHPFVHASVRLDHTLFLAGNFNLTNTSELFDSFRDAGCHPSSTADGYLICELLAAELESGRSIEDALREVLPRLDGAFTLCGMTGSGTAFAVRDARGIRPGWYLDCAGAVAVTSERPAIQAAFDIPPEAVREIPPGEALIISPSGETHFVRVLAPAEPRPCVFEHIYFSRANDASIHRERKALGAALAEPLLREARGNLADTFFSYIPNSAQVAFHGLLEALWTEGLAEGQPVRFGQIAVKDAKFRTFIEDAAARHEFGRHVYDVTYGLVRPGVDTLVVLDDSIVRGSTMRNSILPMLDRLGPRRIIVASSAPPIRYPDCYGIDISTLDELVAFRALVNRLGPDADSEIAVALSGQASDPLAALYARFSSEQHSAEIARLLSPPGMRAEVSVVYQTVEALHSACPGATGDWYFTGNYPTPGGYHILRNAISQHLSHRSGRAY